MTNIFNDDFRDFIKALNDQQVKYVLVGGMAVIIHGHARVTGDMDLWVEQTEKNYKRLERAFMQFGLSMFDMTLNKFLAVDENDVFSFGRNPVGIDIMTAVKGLDFNEVYNWASDFQDGDLLVK